VWVILAVRRVLGVVQGCAVLPWPPAAGSTRAASAVIARRGGIALLCGSDGTSQCGLHARERARGGHRGPEAG